ncbi:MAG: hypothetical protein L3J35_11420 [Bacteroidales bacterium]|nr:hypothetical protein [Bacteroidales bacterium]
MDKNLTIEGIIKDGIAIGLKNFLSILGVLVLWVLTIWIPYINVGTTIAVTTLPMGLSKGNVMSPLEIFDPKYRIKMGEFFVTIGLKMLAMYPAILFMIVPAIILNLSWSLAMYLVIGHEKNPSEALTESNNLTDGHKWTMFFANLILVVAFLIVFYLFSWIHAILGLLVLLVFMPIMLGAKTHIYKKLVLEGASTEEVTE